VPAILRHCASRNVTDPMQDKDSLPRGQLASSFPEGVLFITYSLLVRAAL
jgi:hypothetical protein